MDKRSEDKKRKFSKEEYSEVFNTVFGTHIDWTKLSKEELIELAVVLNHPETFMKNLGINTESIILPRGSFLKVAAKVLRKYGFVGPVTEILEELAKQSK